MELKRDVPPNTVAKMMSNMMYERRYFPLLTQVIVGGVVDKPIMYTLDPLGSVLPDDYAAVGTGAEMALGVLDPQFKPNMSKDEAIDLAKRNCKICLTKRLCKWRWFRRSSHYK